MVCCCTDDGKQGRGYRMNRPVVSIVGGGVFAPRLCEALTEALDLPELELRLTARRADRLRILAHHSAARLPARRPGWSVQGISSVEAALRVRRKIGGPCSQSPSHP